jgi:hypothetical protein
MIYFYFFLCFIYIKFIYINKKIFIFYNIFNMYNLTLLPFLFILFNKSYVRVDFYFQINVTKQIY